MTYVITNSCIGHKDASCHEVCPVDAIAPNPYGPEFGDHDQLFIDAAVCIDCGACEPVCPVGAIYNEYDLPDDARESLATNQFFFAQ
ncbi:MAG: 4Fe-4S binding protein [Brachybacterium sp.]|nr:4Fe-4S binding protein [Brachybacterium sp.]